MQKIFKIILFPENWALTYSLTIPIAVCLMLQSLRKLQSLSFVKTLKMRAVQCLLFRLHYLSRRVKP